MKNQLPKSENQATKLDLIGSVITTLGDAITTIAAGLALDEELIDSNNNIERLQKQIKQIKK
ncbi:translation initiation factor 2 [Lysinibacillus pakistanensis]|uniref:Translation initiation factor 2 n=1 Tax=Lysinibacillus pakistanensis TaxID=759811 RepID=A0ABX6DGF5_9BACI|nr:translation initiation factor 2 [Lysinibacillus pakistanensis]